MEKHTCKHCNRIFEYCRGCLLSPIPHKDAGFCSKECYEASKNVVEPIVTVEIEEPIVEVNNELPTEPIEEETIVENLSTEDVEPVLVDTKVSVEATTPTIKKETYNTYKKKKNKYR